MHYVLGQLNGRQWATTRGMGEENITQYWPLFM